MEGRGPEQGTEGMKSQYVKSSFDISVKTPGGARVGSLRVGSLEGSISSVFRLEILKLLLGGGGGGTRE